MSTHTTGLIARSLVAALLLCGLGTVGAQDSPPIEGHCDVSLAPSTWQAHPRGPDGRLQQLMSPACLGDPKADAANPLVAQFNKATPDQPSVNVVERLTAGRAGLSLLRSHALARLGTAAVGSTPTGLTWRSMAAHLQQVDATVQLALISPDRAAFRDSLALLLPADPFARGLDAANQGLLILDGQAFKLLTETGCDKAAAKCDELFERAELIRAVNLLARLSKYLQADDLLAAQADLALRNARWTAYRKDGRHQYFWEVWLNGKLMDCPQDEKGIPIGFCPVPTRQWLLLHPEAALVFNHKAGQSSDLQPALTIELVGYYRWAWAGESARMHRRHGFSLLAAYTKHEGRNRWGFGPKFVFGDGYHLGVTRAPGGRWSVAVNLPLSDALFSRKQEYTDYLKKIRKPDLGELW